MHIRDKYNHGSKTRKGAEALNILKLRNQVNRINTRRYIKLIKIIIIDKRKIKII